MQMISLNDCKTVMKAACAMQLPLAESLQREALDGSMILPVALDMAIPQSMDVVQRLEFAYHPSLFIKGNICTLRGQRVVQTRGDMQSVKVGGWRRQTMNHDLLPCSCQQ